MTNIVPLKPAHSIPAVTPEQPNEELIEYLEELLAHAKSGELRAAATVLCYAGDKIQTDWINTHSESDRLASGILTLMHRWGAATVGD